MKQNICKKCKYCKRREEKKRKEKKRKEKKEKENQNADQEMGITVQWQVQRARNWIVPRSAWMTMAKETEERKKRTRE